MAWMAEVAQREAPRLAGRDGLHVLPHNIQCSVNDQSGLLKRTHLGLWNEVFLMKSEGYSNEPGYILVALEILQELESCAQMVGEMFSGKQAVELGIVGGPQLNICAEGLGEFVAKFPKEGERRKQ